MPPPKRAAADLGDAFSASAIVGGTATGYHLLHIDCYSQTKEDLPTGRCIKSCPFSAGGLSWYINYFPNGDRSSAAEFISIFLYLDQSISQPVKARVRFSLLDQAGEPVPSHNWITKVHGFCTAAPSFGYSDYIKRAWLEESEHLRDDCFTIRCNVTVTMELRAEKRRPSSCLVVVPPSNLHRNFGDLLESKQGADVTFQVCDETFKAHRCVLAARSAVFKAEVFGTMKESTSRAAIRVDDMDAQVFRALLHFMYTDELLDFQDMKEQEEVAMAQHLLVAADRYNLGRLKLICEDRLCGHIDTASAATILALAEQHCCHGLKEACFKFLSSPSSLNAVMATDGFDHLIRSCPSVLKELMANIAARLPVDSDEALHGNIRFS
jgi:speckle-type POZ protein